MLYYTPRFVTLVLLKLLLMTCLFILSGQAQSTLSLPTNQIVLPSQSKPIKWHWQGDSIHSKWEPHAALLIPVTLPFCQKQFYMQFDLGSTSSIFYTQQIQQIQAKYPQAFAKQDSLSTLKNFHFYADKMKI